jgi:hypothetical protein
MEMAQDCNQRKFGTTLDASIHPFRTGLFAIETAFIQLGLQSTAWGQGDRILSCSGEHH